MFKIVVRCRKDANPRHDGSLCTGHANSAQDMLYRLETMVLMGMDIPLSAVRRQIASGLDVIVHLGRLRDKSRKVLEIVEVTGFEKDEIQIGVLYKFEEKGETEDGKVVGELEKKAELQCTQKMRAAGMQT